MLTEVKVLPTVDSVVSMFVYAVFTKNLSENHLELDWIEPSVLASIFNELASLCFLVQWHF